MYFPVLVLTRIVPTVAIIIACLSAFPQLFAASSRPKKPVYKPTDTYYKRLQSRMKSRKNSRESEDTVNLSVDSLAQDVHHPSPTTEFAVQRPVPVLVSGYPEPATVCYKGSSMDGSLGADGQIKQKLEYQVTRQWV
jgi:hypothetical protein